MRWSWRSPHAFLPVVLTGCSLLVSLDDLSGGGDGGPSDATPDVTPDVSADGGGSDGGVQDASADQSADAPLADGPIVTTIASALTVATATGTAQQTHIIYAQQSARFWLFYIDSNDVQLLKTRYSSDFMTWSDGASLTLPLSHGYEGRNFSVAYANISANDVVHISFSHHVDATTRRRFHTRATISGTTIAFGTPTEVDSVLGAPTANIDPDDTAAAIGSDGRMTDLSGWTHWANAPDGSVGNSEAWRSSSVDNGTSWTVGWQPQADLQAPPDPTTNRGLVALSSAGSLLAFWVYGASNHNVIYSTWDTTNGWLPQTGIGNTVFFAWSDLDPNDWAVCRRTDVDIHAVRRTGSLGYEHARYNGTAWVTGTTIAADGAQTGAGLFLACGPSTVSLFSISTDAAHSIRTTTWTGATWSAWSTLIGSAATRNYLTGYTSLTPAKNVLLWTETNGPQFDIVGALLP